jgi:hypothetical protein
VLLVDPSPNRLDMSLSEAITASTPANTSSGRKVPVSNNNASNEKRHRNKSPAFLAYEAKKNACDARITDIRARIVKQNISSPFFIKHFLGCFLQRILHGCS